MLRLCKFRSPAICFVNFNVFLSSDRMRRLVETKVEKKRRRKGSRQGSKRKKKSTKRCPAKRTPQCSVLHEWHEKHLQYHQVMDAKLLKQVNERPCRLDTFTKCNICKNVLGILGPDVSNVLFALTF